MTATVASPRSTRLITRCFYARLFQRQIPVVVNLPSRRNKSNSAKWFARQRGDPFLKQRDGLQFRARSAFKLLEIQERYPFLPNVKERSKGAPLDPEDIVIVDLGAAPGSWSQVVARLLGRDWEDVMWEGWGASTPRPHDQGTVISVDLLPIEPIPGCHTIQGDFVDPATWKQIEAKICGRAKPDIDVLLSDIAPSATGINSTDTESQLELNRTVLEFAQRYLRKGGTLLMKHFIQAASGKFKKIELDPLFHAVKLIKPSASRKQSPEVYYLCRGFKSNTKQAVNE